MESQLKVGTKYVTEGAPMLFCLLLQLAYLPSKALELILHTGVSLLYFYLIKEAIRSGDDRQNGCVP
jgi:hypothetical protein